MSQCSAEPLAWGTRVSLPHLPSPPSWVGTEAALASLERNREIHQKTPCEVAGKASPGAGLRQGCGLWHPVPIRSCVPTICGAVAEMLPRGGRAAGSSLGWACGGTVPALNVNVGSSAEQTTRGCPVLQGRGRGGALAHQVTIQHPPPGVPRASCARETKPTSWQSVNNKPHQEHTIKAGLKTHVVWRACDFTKLA